VIVFWIASVKGGLLKGIIEGALRVIDACGELLYASERGRRKFRN
jgi:hypothetical protein